MGQKQKTEYYVRTMNGLRLNKTLTRTYCGNYIYENNDFVQVLFDGGYITFNGSDAEYHYYIQDHLGNNRIVAKTRGIPEQTNHYYPFGSLMGTSSDGDTQRYKYNGKELDRMNGLDLYDYGARFYDGIRFTTMDPLAEKYYSVSPYAYCANNPIRFIDPDGRIIVDDYGIIKDFQTYINNAMAKTEDLSMLSFFNTINKRIKTLEESNITYVFEYTEEKDMSETSYQDGKIVVRVDENTIGLIGHELTHCYQFETGKLSFKKDGSPGLLYDITDEVAAYKTQYKLEQGPRGQASSQITKKSVKEMKDSRGVPLYELVPTKKSSYRKSRKDQLKEEVYNIKRNQKQ